MYNGNHYACKIVAVKAEIPHLNINSGKDFKARVEMEVNLVQELKHVSSSFCLSAFIMVIVVSGPYRAIHTMPGIPESEYRDIHASL